MSPSLRGLFFIFLRLTAHEGVEYLPFTVAQSHHLRWSHVVIDKKQIQRLRLAVRLDQFFISASASRWVT